MASALYFSVYGDQISLHELLITLFLFITAPVSALLMAKAAIHVKTKHRATEQTDTD
jgi:multicomponent K+:H+ antiporter subunit G